ncbi:hypothetical protein HDU79_000979 [Rhizoclosmatium sp. JEL0117]|nr:hypothetical protein HDU79_000979 [Rhizoclosmatium sp. JEL0117]
MLLASLTAQSAVRSVPRLACRRFSAATQRDDEPTLTLFSRKYCGLCDHARENILLLKDHYKFVLDIEDIDLAKNKHWKEKYNYEVPVLHINGKPAMMNAVPIDTLEEILKALKE